MNKSLLARISQNCRGGYCQRKEQEGNQVKKQHEEDYPYLEAIHSSNKLSQGSLHRKTAGQPIKLKDNLLFSVTFDPWLNGERNKHSRDQNVCCFNSSNGRLHATERVKFFPCTFLAQTPALQQQYCWTAVVIEMKSQKRAGMEEKW